MWISPWIKLSWHSCSMQDKLRWLNWFWQFLCEGQSSFNSKRLYYSYAWSCSLCERRTSFCMVLISKKPCRFLLIILTSFTSFSVLLVFLLLIIFFVVIHSFLLKSLTVILTVLPFWIYLFLLTLAFVLQWLSLHWQILIMWFSQFPLTFQ